MSLSFTVRTAQPQELEAAFRLQFRVLSPEDRECRVSAALALVRNGEFDPAGVLVAQVGGVIQGVLVCQRAPGASALLWPPSVEDTDNQHALEDGLVCHAIDLLRQGGAKLAHALLTEYELGRAAALERNGIARVTRLWYLRHPLHDLPPFAPRLECLPYSSVDPTKFCATLLRTYEGTLDCPEVNHVRTADEVLFGHRAHGLHKPERWWLACADGEPVSVLLLADVPALGGWELSYLGVVPEARRQGVGRELTCRALEEAHRAGASHLSLAVDERNDPARGLYRTLGFEPFDFREMLLIVFGQSAGWAWRESLS